MSKKSISGDILSGIPNCTKGELTVTLFNFVFIPTSLPKTESTLRIIVSVPAFNIHMEPSLYALSQKSRL